MPAERLLGVVSVEILVVLGVGEDWELELHAFELRSERLAAECPCSLRVVRGRAEATAPAS